MIRPPRAGSAAADAYGVVAGHTLFKRVAGANAMLAAISEGGADVDAALRPLDGRIASRTVESRSRRVVSRVPPPGVPPTAVCLGITQGLPEADAEARISRTLQTLDCGPFFRVDVVRSSAQGKPARAFLWGEADVVERALQKLPGADLGCVFGSLATSGWSPWPLTRPRPNPTLSPNPRAPRRRSLPQGRPTVRSPEKHGARCVGVAGQGGIPARRSEAGGAKARLRWPSVAKCIAGRSAPELSVTDSARAISCYILILYICGFSLFRFNGGGALESARKVEEGIPCFEDDARNCELVVRDAMVPNREPHPYGTLDQNDSPPHNVEVFCSRNEAGHARSGHCSSWAVEANHADLDDHVLAKGLPGLSLAPNFLR